ncbi:MAG: hypothetical protein M3083_12620 [Actinomycetota bacterium]|nr:hypothetical protein [Actinomycetota bacterium]
MTTPFSTFNRGESPWPPTGPSWEAPEAAQRLAPGAPLVAPTDVANWLDEQERNLAHPKVVEDGLRRAGWHPVHAAMEVARYRTRFNEHQLGYSALLVSTGVAALALGTVGHILASGLDRSVNRNSLSAWLTVFVVSLPFAIWAHVWAAQVDRDDPVAVWSQPRRSLALALLWGCGIVGIGRLAIYGGRLVGALLGATWAAGDSTAAGAVNVAITVSIALPLGLWAFFFLHRFDDEDPSQPSRRRRRGR